MEEEEGEKAPGSFSVSFFCLAPASQGRAPPFFGLQVTPPSPKLLLQVFHKNTKLPLSARIKLEGP